MSDQNREYLERRAATARKLAENAASAGIRNIHLEMAKTYETMTRDNEGSGQPRG